MDDDDDSVLDLADQTNRPADTALMQQRVNAWHPILDPVWVILALFYLGVIMLPVGFKIDSIQDSVEELKVTYDNYEDDNYTTSLPDCRIGDEYNRGKECFIRFTTTRDLNPPILIHYELTNFHQNHRAYYSSKDPYQLLGNTGKQDPISKEACEPLNELDGITLNPCGLVANTLFNDKFTLVGGVDIWENDLELLETGIAWQSDLDYLFDHPEGFNSSQCESCVPECCEPWDSCTEPWVDPSDPTGQTCYRYYYPKDDTTQYLHETYPDIIPPIEGVRNEHFVVWMRIATQPNFRKLYGWIDKPIRKNTTITFKVNANYVVTRFKGSKSLILSTTSIFGGRNPYLAPVFIVVGAFCLVAGAFFSFKHIFRPRKLADPAYLHYKEE